MSGAAVRNRLTASVKQMIAAICLALCACVAIAEPAAAATVSSPVTIAPAPVSVVPVRHLFSIEGLVLPSDLVIASNRIFIVDGGDHRIVVTDLKGAPLFTFGKHGSGPGEFNGPVGIAAAGNGEIVVCDSGNARVQIFGTDGRLHRQFPVADLGGHAARPVDAVFNPARNSLYISDGNNNKILSYSIAGRYLFEWGRRGNLPQEFRYPATLAFGPDRTVYVVDIMNSRVQRFSETGAATVAVGEWGVLPGTFFRPKGVALDDAGNIYVSDSYLDVIQVFAGARFLYALGDESGAPRKFDSPGGIAIQGDRIYAVEMFGRRVGVYELP